MNGLVKICILAFLVNCTVSAEVNEGKLQFQGQFTLISPNRNLWQNGLEMLDEEREEYARQLTRFALQQIKSNTASSESIAKARKFITVALSLSPRNKESVVANTQLSKGILPKVEKSGFNKETLSTLLYVRAKKLREAEGEANLLLARVFIELAARVNPLNKNAVDDAKVLSEDHGELNWNKMRT